MVDPATVEYEALINDPLFRRLWAIRQAVESGRADPQLVEQWEELRESVTHIVDSLRATMLGVPASEREKVARAWIEAFCNERWPGETLH